MKVKLPSLLRNSNYTPQLINNNKSYPYVLSGLGIAIYYKAGKCIKFFLETQSINYHLLNINNANVESARLILNTNNNSGQNIDIDKILTEIVNMTQFSNFILDEVICRSKINFLIEIHKKCKTNHIKSTDEHVLYCTFD